MEEKETVEIEKKGVQAKPVSLWCQILAAVWMAGWSAWKFISQGGEVDIGDIVASSMAIIGCFSPVYISIMLDKIKEIKYGNK